MCERIDGCIKTIVFLYEVYYHPFDTQSLWFCPKTLIPSTLQEVTTQLSSKV